MKPKKHIKVVHIASGDLWAGAEAQLFTLTTTLQRETEIDVHVVLMNHGILEERLLAEKIPVIVLDETIINSITIFFFLIKVLRKINPDIVHTHRQKENIIGSIACLFLGNCPSIRTVHGATEHSPKISNPQKYFFYKLDILCGRYIQKKAIAVSDDLAKKIKSDFQENKILTVLNGVNIQSVTNAAKAFHPQLPCNEKKLKIGMISRLVQVKRIDLFINVAEYFTEKAKSNDFCFYIFGDGPLEPDLQATINKKQLTNNIRLMGHKDNIFPYMNQMEIILITSDHEGLPMNLLEAMALEIPIISNKVGGITNLLMPIDGQLLVNSREPVQYYNAINYYTKKKDCEKKQLKRKLHQAIQKKYSSSLNSHDFVAIYRKLKTSH